MRLPALFRTIPSVRVMRCSRRLALASTLVVTAIAATGCSDDSTAPAKVATTLVKMSGDNQTTAPSTTIANPLIVQVNDQNGTALAGQVVTWAVTNGAGTLTNQTSTSDANGQASASYTPDATVGTATITATVGTLSPVTFTITVAAAP